MGRKTSQFSASGPVGSSTACQVELVGRSREMVIVHLVGPTQCSGTFAREEPLEGFRLLVAVELDAAPAELLAIS